MPFLLIEFLDELSFGLEGAAWPLLRDDFGLDYLKVGILLSAPGLAANLVEPVLYVLGDLWRRRVLILGGGLVATLSLLLIAVARNFWILLVALILFAPASGAFVNLSQATLVDEHRGRGEQALARWTLAGSLGVFVGPLVLSGMLAVGWGWRAGFLGLATLSAIVLAIAARQPASDRESAEEFPPLGRIMEGLLSGLGLLRRTDVVRWLLLLEFADLMLDVLFGYLALFFVDVAGASPGTAALAVATWSGAGLAGDALVIPVLGRSRAMPYLRGTIVVELLLFPAFLLAPTIGLKIGLLALLGLFNSGWYAILRARLFESAPGQSATVLALDNVGGTFGRLLAFLLGWAALRWGLGNAMWLMLLGPLALLVGLPRNALASAQQRAP